MRSDPASRCSSRGRSIGFRSASGLIGEGHRVGRRRGIAEAGDLHEVAAMAEANLAAVASRVADNRAVELAGLSR